MDTTETEAKHLREILLRASAELAAAGFEGVFEMQIAKVLERARQAEECAQELVKLQGQLGELRGGLAP